MGLDVVIVDVDGTVLDPVVGSAYACLPNGEEGGMGSSLFCALVIFLLPPGILVVVDACLVPSLTWKSTPRVRSSSLHIPEVDSRVATLLLIVHASPKVGLIYDTISVGARYSFLYV